MQFGCFLLVILLVMGGILGLIASPGSGPCFPIPCQDDNTSGPVGMDTSEKIGWIIALPFAIIGGGIAAWIALGVLDKLRGN